MTKLYIDAEANNHPVNEHPRLSGHKQAVISLSGGMDSSTVLLRLLTEGYQVTAISFDYGQKHNVELLRAAELVDYLNQNGYKGRIRRQCITMIGLKEKDPTKIDQLEEVKLTSDVLYNINYNLIKFKQFLK